MSYNINSNSSFEQLEEYIKLKNRNILRETGKFIREDIEFDSFSTLKNDLLEYAKANYLYELKLLEPDESTSDIFFWYRKPVKIWCIGINDSYIGERRILNFATKNEEDAIEMIDAVQITTSTKFYKMNILQKISFLIEKNIIPDISNNIIHSSLNRIPYMGSWAEVWVEKEANNIDSLIKSPAEIIDFNKSIIRAKRYNFEEMLAVINNDQFTMEFDECLFAYNNQKWFVCAAGLGGILEHLIYLTLEKNNLIDSNFPDDATAKIYIEHLSRKPIKMKKREKTHLRSLFLIRNSVSHFNQGFTSKDQCQTLMNGIRDFFNNYYIKDFNLDDN